MCKSYANATKSMWIVKEIMGKLDLTLSKEKSKLVTTWNGEDGFDFLGFHHRKFLYIAKGGERTYYLSHIPSRKAMKKMRASIKAYTEPRSKLSSPLDEIIKGLNRRLQGFKNYYQVSSKSKQWLNRIDWYVIKRLTLFWNKKRNQSNRHGKTGEITKLTRGKLVKLAS